MAIDQWIQVTVEINNSGLTEEGFGTIGILSHKSVFPERARLYASIDGMISDGYAANSIEVRNATAITNQQPSPPNWLVLNASDNVPTQQYTMQTLDVAANQAYSIDVDAEGDLVPTTIAYTSGASPIRAQINAGLVAALNDVADANYTAAFAAAPTFSPTTFTSSYPSTPTIFAATGHGFLTGDGPVELTNSGGALPTGLATATPYYIVTVDANHFSLATSLANALAASPVVISVTSAGTGTSSVNEDTTLRPDSPFTVTGNAAGDWFSLGIENTTLITGNQTHSANSVGTSLAAIFTYNDTWFWLATSFNSKLYVEACASFCSSNKLAYVVDFSDTDAANVAEGSGTDGPAALFGLEYADVMYSFHDHPNAMLSAATMGLLAPKNPGRWTAAFKSLAGVDPVSLTPDQVSNLEARDCGSYTTEAGRNITWDGQVASPDYGFLDNFVKIQFETNDLQTSLFGVLVGNDVVGYTDEDLQKFVAAGNGVIARGVSDAYKIMAPGNAADPVNDPPPTFTVPLVADIDPSARALREVPDMQLAFRMQGAVQDAQVNIVASF
jgi:hypothetical protein